jgi:hypothetical protein
VETVGVARKDVDKARGGGAPAVGGTLASESRTREKKKMEDSRATANRQNEQSGRDEAGESRTVNGRHFQRRSGIWVDASYNSSAATTNFARGSEQYRALIADEPGIDAIVKQLSGEVILVWKGRAYRIR